MPDVFVSYSRRDAAFVEALVEELERRGKSSWVDTSEIGGGEVFPDAIRLAIEGSDAFVFVITPAAVTSRYCETEVEHALALGKRIVPVLREPLTDEAMPDAIRVRHWIDFTAGVDRAAASAELVAAIETDREYVSAHTRWLVKALQWEADGRDASALLRGRELQAAEQWLQSARAEPEPTALQREYLSISRSASSRRQRALLIASLTVAAVSIALLVFALINRSDAQRQARVAKRQTKVAVSTAIAARSRRLAAESQAQLAIDPERSILLGMQAVRKSPTAEALFALRRAIDTSPLLRRLPSVPPWRGWVGGGEFVSYSPDGALVAEGSMDGHVVILASRSGKVVRRLSIEGAAYVPTVAFSPSGRSLAVATNHDVRIVDARTGATQMIARGKFGTYGGAITYYAGGFAFSRDGSVLYFADGTRLARWDLRAGRIRILARGGRIGPVGAALGFYFVALSRDGRRLTVGGYPGIALLDAATGRVLANAQTDWSVQGLAISRDGRRLVVAESATGYLTGFNEGRAILLDARTLRPQRVISRVEGIGLFAADLSPDGERVALGASDGSAAVYSVRTGKRLFSLPGHTATIWQVRFSPDGRSLITAAADGTALVWRAEENADLAIDTGGVAVAANGNTAWISDLRLLADRIVARYAAGSGAARGAVVINSWSRRGRQTAPPLALGPAEDGAFYRLSPDGRLAVSGSLFVVRPLLIWNVAERKVVRRIRLKAALTGFPTFSRDGTRLVLDVQDKAHLYGSLTILNLVTRQLSHRHATDCAPFGWASFDFSPDGRKLAAVTGCGKLLVWDTTTGSEVGHPVRFGYIVNIGPLRFSPDGTRVAVANSTNEGQVSVIDVASHRIVGVLTNHTGQVQDVTFSPDGALLATASIDGTARIWDARRMRPLRVLDHPDEVNNVAFDPSGRHLATFDLAGVVRLWDACTACTDPAELLAIARTRVTRQLTADERKTFLV